MIKIVSQSNQPIEMYLASVFKRALQAIQDDSGKIMADSMTKTTRDHFERKYPGSQHYSPSKVNPGDSLGVLGQVDIDIPGVTRAYHDIDIRPRYKKHLAIPMHGNAFLGKPAEVPDLLFIKKKDGSAFLAQQLANGSGLRFMYALKDHVHQKQDNTIMPTDEALAENALERVSEQFEKAIGDI